jgi:Plasmid pRiA4b ORF-3-like protein
MLHADRTTLIDMVADTGVRRFDYIYDFGDQWEHTVKIVKPTPAAPGVTYPLLIDGAGRCPLEDKRRTVGRRRPAPSIAGPCSPAPRGGCRMARPRVRPHHIRSRWRSRWARASGRQPGKTDAATNVAVEQRHGVRRAAGQWATSGSDGHCRCRGLASAPLNTRSGINAPGTLGVSAPPMALLQRGSRAARGQRRY